MQEALSQSIQDTFNMVSVDGDTSTNDTVLLLANGMAGNEEITEKNESYGLFCQALNEVNTFLAKAIAADGEGATALFEVKVIHAKDKEQAVTLSKSVITSSLTKAAIFGHDANWEEFSVPWDIPARSLIRRKWICILKAPPENLKSSKTVWRWITARKKLPGYCRKGSDRPDRYENGGCSSDGLGL